MNSAQIGRLLFPAQLWLGWLLHIVTAYFWWAEPRRTLKRFTVNQSMQSDFWGEKVSNIRCAFSRNKATPWRVCPHPKPCRSLVTRQRYQATVRDSPAHPGTNDWVLCHATTDPSRHFADTGLQEIPSLFTSARRNKLKHRGKSTIVSSGDNGHMDHYLHRLQNLFHYFRIKGTNCKAYSLTLE